MITKMITNVPLTCYSLDFKNKIKVNNLLFIDTYSSLEFDLGSYKEMREEERLRLIEMVMESLDSSTNKGFLPCYDLSKFPIISELLGSFLIVQNDEWVKGCKSMETYKWLYNFVLLSLYLLCLESLKLEDLENFSEFKCKERELYERLDPSIRHHLQKRGISIKENIYIGFDTEFAKYNSVENCLVSVQLAVNTKTYVQIPRVKSYKVSILDEKTNRLINQNQNSDSFNYLKLELSIQKCIERARRLKYAEYDRGMLIMSESLKLIQGLSYYDKDDYTIFSTPSSLIQPFIHFGDSFSLKQILDVSSGIAKPFLDYCYNQLINLIQTIASNNFTISEGKDKLIQEIKSKFNKYNLIAEIGVKNAKPLPLINSEQISWGIGEKRLTRNFLALLSQKMSVTKTKCYYLIAHLTQADLSMLSDFEEIKEDLSIVNGSFVTIGNPIVFSGKSIHVRDTMLLAPGGSKSLATIGKLYSEEFQKLKIQKEDLEDMKGFLKRDKVKFTDYALRDALISLIHASWMEDFYFKIGGVGVPLSLSSIGRSYVKSIWAESGYRGYQISQKHLLGDVSTSITPKGLNVLSKIGFILPLYIANYKGGRNECFMYGVDRCSVWFDYDLSSAYTTIMAMAGHPEYEKCKRLTVTELKRLKKEEMVYNYLIISADFEFPNSTKYPSIPCYVDENCTVYPLKGTCVLTGSEYVLAINQGCKFKFHDIYITPIKTYEYKDCKPFSTVLKKVQEQRREHIKGTISNYIYKEIGNSIYGSVVRGIGNKRKFDIRSKGTIRMVGDDLTNPLIASWTTAFIRSIIGECLHSIDKLGGLVVSVTTDGFITNIEGLEDKISGNFLLGEFKKIREELSESNKGLELKTSGLGIIAWSTRGQLGFDSKIIATTGFQNRIYGTKKELIDVFLHTIKSEHKTIEYVQSTLRSAKDIYTKGGHVTMQYRDQYFRMHYDNRRVLKWETTIPAKAEVLIDSIPLLTAKEGENLRYISGVHKKKLYGKYTSVGNRVNKYKITGEIAVRNFVKGVLTNPMLFNLTKDTFYTNRDLIEFIECYNPLFKYNDVILTQYKNRKVKLLKTPRSKESEDFVKYVKIRFPHFTEEGFYSVV